MNFFCRRPNPETSGDLFPANRTPRSGSNSAPADSAIKRDDASISLSSWANIDTDKAGGSNLVFHRRLYKSDGAIRYDGSNDRRPSSKISNAGNSINKKIMSARDIDQDDASIGVSSWANIDANATSSNDRLVQSDSAIQYNGLKKVGSKNRSKSRALKSVIPAKPPLAPQCHSTNDSLPPRKPRVVQHHDRESSWGNVDVLSMLKNIEHARERVAQDLKKQKQKGATAVTSKPLPPPTTRNNTRKFLGHQQHKNNTMRPPLAGGRSKTASLEENRERSTC